MKKLRSLLIIILVTITNQNISSQNSVEKIQQLHKKISDDLISIRKSFPKSQRVVYSLLDQVCKIYKISKEKIEKENRLKIQIHEKISENDVLKKENVSLKEDLDSLKKELTEAKQSLTSATKTLDQNKSLINSIKKENQKLESEKNQLAQEKNQLLKASQIQQQKGQYQDQQTIAQLQEKQSPLHNDFDYKNSIKNLYPHKMKHRKHNNNIENDQNLRLTSTSEPISPR